MKKCEEVLGLKAQGTTSTYQSFLSKVSKTGSASRLAGKGGSSGALSRGNAAGLTHHSSVSPCVCACVCVCVCVWCVCVCVCLSVFTRICIQYKFYIGILESAVFYVQCNAK